MRKVAIARVTLRRANVDAIFRRIKNPVGVNDQLSLIKELVAVPDIVETASGWLRSPERAWT